MGRAYSTTDDPIVIRQPLSSFPPVSVSIQDVYPDSVLRNIAWKWKVVSFAVPQREQRYVDTDGVVRVAMKVPFPHLPRLIVEYAERSN